MESFAKKHYRIMYIMENQLLLYINDLTSCSYQDHTETQDVVVERRSIKYPLHP